jgi:Protein of unknown function (DUF3775)
VPSLTISPEKVCFVAAKARAFDVKDVLTVPDSGSNPTDDGMAAVLEDIPDDPVVPEIAEFIAAMNDDERADLVTLTWLGRGDDDVAAWNELRAEAARLHGKRTAAYLLGLPLLSDLLEEGLACLGLSCADYPV